MYVYVAVVCYGTLGVDPVRIEGEGGERRGMKGQIRWSISMDSTRVYNDVDKRVWEEYERDDAFDEDSGEENKQNKEQKVKLPSRENRCGKKNETKMLLIRKETMRSRKTNDKEKREKQRWQEKELELLSSSVHLVLCVEG